MISSDLRPRGTVERECSTCQWRSWFDPLSPEATALPFVCSACVENPIRRFGCDSCNRVSSKPHRDIVAEYAQHAHLCQECSDAGVKPREYAAVVYCWAHKHRNEPQPLATQFKRWPRGADPSPSQWQLGYHVCDACAADWIQDLPEAEQKKRLRARGVKVTEYPDGTWSYGGGS